jgi:chromosome partitioning protein
VIVAFLNHKGGVGKTTLALHVAEAWAAQSKRIVVDDTDSQGSALDRSEQRTKEGLPQLFDVLEFARDPLHVEAPEITRDANHVVIDGSSHAAALMRSAMLAADLTLVSAQPSPFDGWASSETFRLLHEARLFRPPLIVWFVLNGCVALSRIASEIAEALAKHDSPALGSRVGQHVGFAKAACTGRLMSEVPRSEPAAREVAALAAKIERIAR